MRDKQKGVVVLPVLLVLFTLGILAFFALSHQSGNPLKDIVDKVDRKTGLGENQGALHNLSPVEAGKRLTRGNCEGKGAEKLSVSPMNLEDIGVLIPYGSTTGGHVTPIDHLYFYPADFESAPDTYEVYAQADGTIYYLDENKYFVEESAEVEGDYAIKFSQTCTHLYWYGLLSSLSPRLQKALGGSAKEGETYSKYVNIPVKEGELVGYIGGRTLDYGVLDTTKPLGGFISPELYEIEREKIFTADPFDYYTKELAELLQRKNVRTAEPLGGKIDYDIKGKLRGNWFLEGTYGYAGFPPNVEDRRNYWRGHLSIYPDHIDPGTTIVSVGDFEGESKQFAVLEDIDPSNVGVGDGIIKYTLTQINYVTPDGGSWDGFSTVKGLRLEKKGDFIEGCAIFEMPREQKLKAEFISRASCDGVDGFSSDVRVYER